MFLKTKREKIADYLNEVGCSRYVHIKNQSLLEHLLRVGNILEELGAPEFVVHAGLCHSLYSTENFDAQVVNISSRNELRSLVGDDSENLIFIFCTMARKSLEERAGIFYYIERHTGTQKELSKDTFTNLLYLIIANEVDHFSIDNHRAVLARINHFLRYSSYLSPTALEKLSKLKIESLHSENSGYLRFIAHAGVQILDKVSMVIDPWIYSSNFNNPVLLGFEPGQRTIDYQIPESINEVADLSPDIVMVSHWHTHHSPFREIKEFAINKDIILIGPTLSEQKLALIKKNLGDHVFSRIKFNLIEKDEEFVFEDIKIKAFTHTHNRHLGYVVDTKNIKIVHVSDARVNTDANRVDLDKVWQKIYKARPDFMFISAAGHINKHLEGLHRSIVEHNSLSPAQAAKIVEKVEPKNVSLVGIYNFSMWDSKYEFSHSVEEIEKAFEWTLSFLSPNINILKPRPGEMLSKW